MQIILPSPIVFFSISLAFFHLSEFCLQLLFNTAEVSRRSWLISWPYTSSMAMAVMEFIIEQRCLEFFSEDENRSEFTSFALHQVLSTSQKQIQFSAARIKNSKFIAIAPFSTGIISSSARLPDLYSIFLLFLALIRSTGILCIIIGECVRKVAIFTAGRHFTHDIKISKRSGHTLIQRGIYRYVRHPGYAGFFIWSIGTQLLLLNPICTIMFGNITWRFFKER